MSVAETFLNAENMRTLLLLIAMFSGFIWLKYSISKDMEQLFEKFNNSMNKKIDEYKKNT